MFYRSLADWASLICRDTYKTKPTGVSSLDDVALSRLWKEYMAKGFAAGDQLHSINTITHQRARRTWTVVPPPCIAYPYHPCKQVFGCQGRGVPCRWGTMGPIGVCPFCHVDPKSRILRPGRIPLWVLHESDIFAICRPAVFVWGSGPWLQS